MNRKITYVVSYSRQRAYDNEWIRKEFDCASEDEANECAKEIAGYCIKDIEVTIKDERH